MTDQSNDNNEVSLESLQQQLAEKDEMLQNMQQQFNSVKSKADQLLDETKKAKNKAREEHQAAELAKRDKAEKEGNFEQLFKSSEQQRKDLEERLSSLNNKVSSERTRSESMRIAAELADGANAEILSEFVSKRLKYTDDGLKVLDGNGDLTVSGIDDLKREFENSDKFQSLLRGNKSSGGGASGDGGSASGAAKVQRAQFDKLNAGQKMDFIKKGGKVID